jgi:hypothetical protein
MNKITFDPETLAPVVEQGNEESDPKLELHQRGILSNFGGLRFGNIPVGDALIGGTAASLVSELTDAFTPKDNTIVSALIKIVGGNLLAGAFSGILGNNATSAARLLVTYDGLRDIIPLDGWIREILDPIKKAVPVKPNGVVGQSQPPVNVAYGPGQRDVMSLDNWMASAARGN